MALTLPAQMPGIERKLTQTFIFMLLCCASKDFIKAFIEPFEGPQRCV